MFNRVACQLLIRLSVQLTKDGSPAQDERPTSKTPSLQHHAIRGVTFSRSIRSPSRVLEYADAG